MFARPAKPRSRINSGLPAIVLTLLAIAFFFAGETTQALSVGPGSGSQSTFPALQLRAIPAVGLTAAPTSFLNVYDPDPTRQASDRAAENGLPDAVGPIQAHWFPTWEEVHIYWPANTGDGGSAITHYELQIDEGDWMSTAGADWKGCTLHSDFGLIPGDSHQVRVRAVNANGTGKAGSTSITLTVPPDAPESSAESGDNSITLSWDEPANGGSPITGYGVTYFKHQDGAPPVFVQTTQLAVTQPGSSSAHAIDALEGGTIYLFHVWAITDAGWGPGGSISAIAGPVAAPTAPTIARLHAGNQSLVVNWSAPSQPGAAITNYDLRYREGDDAEAEWREVDAAWNSADGGELSYQLDELANAQIYSVQIRAENSEGEGSWSGEASGTPQADAEGAPDWGQPSITGTAAVGRKLTVDITGLNNPDDALHHFGFRYRWLRSGTPISGATGASYILSEADRDQAIAVRVTFQTTRGYALTRTSDSTDPVTGPGGGQMSCSVAAVTDTDARVASRQSADPGAEGNQPDIGKSDTSNVVSKGPGSVSTVGTRADNGPEKVVLDVDENTVAFEHIGAPVVGSVANRTYAYSLEDGHISFFGINGKTGQLLVGAPLNFEDRSEYEVVVIARDGSGGTARIPVTINVNNLDESGIVSPSWRKPQIAVAVEASLSDPDGEVSAVTWKWLRGDRPRGSFSEINNATSATYTPGSADVGKYLRASATYTDPEGPSKTASATSLVSVRAAASPNDAPAFYLEPNVYTSGYDCDPHVEAKFCVTVNRHTTPSMSIYYPTEATDSDHDEIKYSISGTESNKFAINEFNGELLTAARFDDVPDPDGPGDKTYQLTITASDPSGASNSIAVEIELAGSRGAVVVEGPREIKFPENGTWRVAAYRATIGGENPVEVNGWLVSVDPGGGDGDHFAIDHDGILRFRSPPDFDNPKDSGGNNEYNFTVTAYNPNPPGDQRPEQTFVAIRVFVTDSHDEFEIRGPASVAYPENGTQPVASYTAPNGVGTRNWLPPEGADGAKFTIDSSGVLRFRSPPDFEANASADGDSDYVVSVVVRDQNETLRKDFVQINVTDVNEPPAFDEGASAIRNVDDNAAVGDPVGNPVTATDPDAGARLTYSLGGTDAALFEIENDSGQLKTSTEPLDPQLTYTVTVSVSDGIPDPSADDSITITISVIDINQWPKFDANLGTSIDVPENTPVGADIGDPFTATDPENDPITYTLGGDDADFFDINSATGQLLLDEVLDYESPKKSYAITIYVSDSKNQLGNRDTAPDDEIDVTVNVTDVNEPPQLPAGPITLVVPENTESNRDIGNPLTATDPEGDFLTYTLDDVSALTFDIVSSVGQLTTKAPLDHEANPSYAVSVSVSDGKNEAGDADPSADHTIEVTINVTDVNESPTLISGPITLEVDENKPAGTNIGSPLAAVPDPENDRLAYTLGGVDEDFFDIDSTGQLKARAALDFEHSHGPSYFVTVSVTDGKDQNFNLDTTPDDEIDVTINVADVNERPRFADRAPTRSALETGSIGDDIGGPIIAVDPEDRTLTYTLGGRDAASFDIIDSSGQLQTDSALDFDAQSRYTVTVSVSDGEDSEFNSDPTIDDTVTVTINVTDANRGPQFPGTTADRSILENTPADRAIGEPLAATDDEGDQLTYSLGGTDSAFFDLDRDNGQLKTLAVLDYEHSHGPSYSVTVSVTDGKRADGTIDDAVDASVAVTITVEDMAIPPIPAAPSVAPGEDKALSITWTPENAGVNRPIDSYEVRYRVKEGLIPDWIENASNVSVSGNSATIDELDYGVIYEVQLQARNSEGPGGWSGTGEGLTDMLKLSVAYGQASYSVNEGDDLSIMVTVSPATDRELELPIAVDPGSAETGDYEVSGLSDDALVFDTGSGQMLFTITTVDDADGSNEVLTLRFGTQLPRDVSTGVPASARVTIVDGDRTTTTGGGGGGGGGGLRNRRATGKPVILGLPEVGQELTVSTDGIADRDGLTNVSYSYNWIRELDGVIAVIRLQSGDSYTLAEADSDHAIRVRVSFRDDRRNSESLTSDPTAVVAPAFGRRPSQQPPIQAEPNAFALSEAPVITVLDNRYVEGPGNDNLKHNIPNLEIAWKDVTRTADFLTHYDITGGLERWGYPVSEVLVLESGALTQFYQRGAVDFHNVGQGWAIERRLTWEYVGGVNSPAGDQGTEPVLTNPHPGRLTGPWGHKVSNYSVDGVEVHFAAVHYRLGQTLAFGYPLSDARINFLVPGLLHAPSTTPGFVRQFFQAAIFEYHPIYPDNPVMLTLLGDILRDILVPNHAIHAPFNAQPELEIGQIYKAYYVNDAVG